METGLIAGVDEAGRGPLAGPVYAAAVILDPNYPIDGLNDSKKLTEKKREALFDAIQAHSLAVGVAAVKAATIDEINILQATFLAMSQAIEKLDSKPYKVLIDGHMAPPLPTYEVETIIKGDQSEPAIMAASIVAKVLRDRRMREFDTLYPAYGFKQHKGYGTQQHLKAIKAHGPCPIHRLSFRGTSNE